MTDQHPEPQHLPHCPVCGTALTDDDTTNFTQELRDGTEWEGEVVECPTCFSIIPIEALRRWDELRRLPVDSRIDEALRLLQASADPYDKACVMLRELRVR